MVDFPSRLLFLAEFLEARFLSQRIPERIDSKIAAGFAIGHFEQMRQGRDRRIDIAKLRLNNRERVSDYDSDALAKPFAETALAIVQAQTGDIDSAIAALPHLLEVPNGQTRGDLRIDPLWDPLRKDPRFQKLCEEKQP